MATSLVLFLVPLDIAPAGLSGIATIINEYTGFPIGAFIILANIPVQVIAFRVLQGWRTLLTTVYAVTTFALLTDTLSAFALAPTGGITDDLLLGAIFGGIIGGVGGGLIYRAGGTMGGTSTLARVLRHTHGISLSTASLYTDSFVILLAAVTYGWEAALYAVVTLFVSRTVSDYALDGGGSTRTAFIASEYTLALEAAVRKTMAYSPTRLRAENDERDLLMVTVGRARVHELNKLIHLTDPDAFVTYTQNHHTFGHGFDSFQSKLPVPIDEIDDGADAVDTQAIRTVKREYDMI